MTDYSESAQQNPAAGADGKSLAKLFATDPLELSEQDRMHIVEAFQKERKNFMEKEKGGKKGRQRKKSQPIQDLDINLDEDINL